MVSCPFSRWSAPLNRAVPPEISIKSAHIYGRCANSACVMASRCRMNRYMNNTSQYSRCENCQFKKDDSRTARRESPSKEMRAVCAEKPHKDASRNQGKKSRMHCGMLTATVSVVGAEFAQWPLLVQSALWLCEDVIQHACNLRYHSGANN
jgi:hypothetical protein